MFNLSATHEGVFRDGQTVVQPGLLQPSKRDAEPLDAARTIRRGGTASCGPTVWLWRGQRRKDWLLLPSQTERQTARKALLSEF